MKHNIIYVDDEALEKEWASIYRSKPWDPEEMKMKIETALNEY